jgi:eukaryotic-like serine/threonine-protein kinase
MDIRTTATPLLNNRYQLLQSLGTGGMAVVYRAHDLMLERTVAIKILREDYSQDEDFRERFRQEAKAAANLSHPNIVTVHDFGLDAGRLFIVMEYVPGTDLKMLLRKHGRFSVNEAINLIVQACAGIGYAHRAGLVHCDIKPLNMLVSPDMRLKVTDFGIARALASIRSDEHTDLIWGSPQYFSPEQAAGLAPSPASDVYSLGVILYELLTGQLPFTANDPAELARLHRESTPISPRRLNPEIPVSLEQIILKVLSKEPAARYRTADQLGRVLLTFNQTPETPPILRTPIHNPVSSSQATVVSRASNQAAATQVSEDHSFGIDWITVSLALLTFLAVGGLVPYWLFIYFTFNPPVH